MSLFVPLRQKIKKARYFNIIAVLYVFSIIAVQVIEIFTPSNQAPPPMLTSIQSEDLLADGPRIGTVTVRRGSQVIRKTYQDMQKDIATVKTVSLNRTVSWSIRGDFLTITAKGIDHIHHPANSYLLDYAPFAADKVWEITHYVSQKLRYSLDSKQFGPGFEEIWLTSKQSDKLLRGDCEDHAILIADWLRVAGYDARVVLGRYKNEGHAWVVFFYEGKTYLIEATSKRNRRVYPLAAHLTDYRPEMMFDFDRLWNNTGTFMTTDYRGSHWRLASEFVPDKVLQK